MNIQTKQYDEYIIYNDGRIFSIDLNEFLPIIDNKHQLIVRLYINNQIKYLQIARLVAYCFCNPPNDYKMRYVRHKDKNYHNNNANNLYWDMNYYTSSFVNYYNNLSSTEQNVIRKKISDTRKQHMIGVGKSNSRFKYSFIDAANNELLVADVAKKLNISISRVYAMIYYTLRNGIAHPTLVLANLRMIEH